MQSKSSEKQNERQTRKAFQYRLYPTQKQEQTLLFVLRRCRELYNSALEERRAHYQMRHTGIGYTRQAAELGSDQSRLSCLPGDAQPGLAGCATPGRQNLCRLLPACCHWRNARIPTLQEYPPLQIVYLPAKRLCAGWQGPGKERYALLTLSKMGDLKVRLHRPMQGQVKTCTIRRDGDQWYVTFSCEVDEEPLPPSDEAVGIDLGLLHFATLSTGETIENPRNFRRSLKCIKLLSQIKDRRKKGSHRRKRAAIALAKAHRKVRNQRKDFQHKAARTLVNRFGTLDTLDLQIRTMSAAPDPKADPEKDGAYLPNGASAKAGLNMSLLDAGWGQFQACCVAKAASAGRQVVFVDPRYTSQRCSGCGAIVEKALDERWHSCECGTEPDRDHNAAINILLAGKQPTGSRACRSPAL